MNKWEKRPTDFILGIILHLRPVIQILINIIYFCLGKRDTGSGPLYPIMGFGQITISIIYFFIFNIELEYVELSINFSRTKINSISITIKGYNVTGLGLYNKYNINYKYNVHKLRDSLSYSYVADLPRGFASLL